MELGLLTAVMMVCLDEYKWSEIVFLCEDSTMAGKIMIFVVTPYQ